MGNEVADASVWQARAAAWELAALSLRYPGAELAGAAAGGEWDEAASEILAALGLPAEVPAAAGDPAGLSRRPRGRRRECCGRRRAPARPAPGGHAPVRRRARASLLALRGRVGRRGRRGAAAFVREPPLHGGRALHEGPAASAAPRAPTSPSTMSPRNASSSSTWPCARPAPRLPRAPRTAPTSPEGARPPPTGGSSPGTPKPGCQPSPSAWPPRRAIPSTARRRPTWGRSSGRTLPNRPIPAILPRSSDQVKQCILPGQKRGKKRPYW